jgi:hypothetical protein
MSWRLFVAVFGIFFLASFFGDFQHPHPPRLLRF